MDYVEKALANIINIDPWLEDYSLDIKLRLEDYQKKLQKILEKEPSLKDFANAHHYFGLHKEKEGWTYREWAPNADALYLVGDFNQWNPRSHPLQRTEEGNWEIRHLDLKKGQKIKVIVRYHGQDHYKIPLYIRQVEQFRGPHGEIDWIGKVWDEEDFPWTDQDYKRKQEAPLIYEAHIGMAQEEPKIGSFREFADLILPRIKKAGYNTIQCMAILQHPYYGSFGYHVSNFFAISSWFGSPKDFQYLVNKAHAMDIAVLIDLVHSHAAKNINEGIHCFDGSQEQFFYSGHRGFHPAWDSMCFHYGKIEVLHFLLSNLKYLLEEYHVDGFRFDGVTSMLYWNHGLGLHFTSYASYFSMNTNFDATSYLSLATSLCRQIKKDVLLIAEDMSGFPGLCLPQEDGGLGFDYRLAMGIPDLWIKLLQQRDENWNLSSIYHEVTTKRPKEKKIAYAESHDQALVGDKTLFFRLADPEIYWHMHKDDDHYVIDRAIALHKLIRMVTLFSGSQGYLNFMGNEFGHPEWIDFPREENHWSYHYCRRQWHLADDPNLKYQYLQQFDRDMILFSKQEKLLEGLFLELLWIDQERKLLCYRLDDLVFLYNFHPTNSYQSLHLTLHKEGKYQVVFSTDRTAYGGLGRIDEDYIYQTQGRKGSNFIHDLVIYSPARTGLVLKRI